MEKPRISRKAWPFLLLAVAVIAWSQTSMLPIGRNDSDQGSEAAINIPINTSFINVSIVDVGSITINETKRVVRGNLSLYHRIWVEKSGADVLLHCTSLIETNESYTQYEWIQAMNNDAEQIHAGDVYAGKVAGEEFTVAVVDLTAKRSYPPYPDCTISVRDMLTGDIVKQRMRFIVS